MESLSVMAQLSEIRVPDIGDYKDIPILEVLVKPGDRVKVGDPVVTLESEKATLDVPATAEGRVVSVEVTPGTKVSHGALLLKLAALASDGDRAVPPSVSAPPAVSEPVSTAVHEHTAPTPATPVRIYASPSVRRAARELDLDLQTVQGSGRHGRILMADIQQLAHTKKAIAVPAPAQAPAQSAETPLPAVDFSRFGPIERQPLSRIQRISGPTLARNWAAIPHVTNFDEADITELEAFRKRLNEEHRDGPKLTLTSFLVKACAATLKAHPVFNASLDGKEIILKRYVHIGVAVDTAEGLLVPVIRNADQLGILQIAKEIADKAALARQGKLKLSDFEGGSFTISSLGGIGGTGFTPIINAPEVAILGVSRAKVGTSWEGGQASPRLMLPLSLSWDHRALDGVAAARFLVHLRGVLEDFRRVLL